MDRGPWTIIHHLDYLDFPVTCVVRNGDDNGKIKTSDTWPRLVQPYYVKLAFELFWGPEASSGGLLRILTSSVS